MDDKTRKPDAEDKAPRPDGRPDQKDARERDRANEAERTDGGRSIPDDDLNSANDE